MQITFGFKLDQRCSVARAHSVLHIRTADFRQCSSPLELRQNDLHRLCGPGMAESLKLVLGLGEKIYSSSSTGTLIYLRGVPVPFTELPSSECRRNQEPGQMSKKFQDPPCMSNALNFLRYAPSDNQSNMKESVSKNVSRCMGWHG